VWEEDGWENIKEEEYCITIYYYCWEKIME
jgi:hypothetical protein